MRGQEHTKMLVRVPSDLREWVEEEARRNLVPMTAVIVMALRKGVAAEQREKATG